MFKTERLRGVYGGPFERLSKIPTDRNVLNRLGECLIRNLAKESRKDFVKRGWSGRDPHKGPPIWDSFSYRIRGQSTLEILSSFWGINEMASGDIPKRRMVWLTQDAKEDNPPRYKRTRTEQRLKMKQAGRISKGERMPLVVPLKTKSGQIIFRVAPFKTQDAWVHPGIAKFTFVQRALKKGREQCATILRDEAVKAFRENPL